MNPFVQIGRKSYFLAIVGLILLSIVVNVSVLNFAPQFAPYLRHVGTGISICLAVIAVGRLFDAGCPRWLSVLIVIFFLFIVPIIALVTAIRMGAKAVDPQLEYGFLLGAVYTIVFLIVVGILRTRRHNDDQMVAHRRGPNDRIEPRF